jgi:phosphoserine phosphatase RsbU/P
MLRLVGNDGGRTYAWDLLPGKYILGRSKKGDADFCVDNNTVSRHHASIEVLEGSRSIVLTDLDSRNGTMLNGEKVVGRVEIKPCDILRFGQVEMAVVEMGQLGEPVSLPTLNEIPDRNLEKSVILSIDESRRPLPSQIAGLPEVVPTLLEMAKVLVLPEPREVMLQRSLELIARVIPAERLAILLTADNKLGVTCGASFSQGGRSTGEFNLSKTIIRDILEKKDSLVISDLLQSDHFARQQSIIMSGLKSAMAVPLFDEDKVLGILYADTSNPLHRYNNEYLRLMITFGNIIASRLLNYSLLKERQQRRLMEAERAQAAAIQQNLLPKSIPEVAGYQIIAMQEQSQQVGGDLYDVALLPNGSLIFLMGDVSGKGIGAALLMSDILASFRILYHEAIFDITRAVEMVSMELCRHSEADEFATIFVGIMEPHTHRLSYVNAGHNPPYLVHPDGCLEKLEATGIMIGAFDGVTWERKEIMLQPGDLLIAYTDGVTEARHGEELYSEDRWERQAIEWRDHNAAEIIDTSIADIKRFVGGFPQSDDITLLVVKRSS